MKLLSWSVFALIVAFSDLCPIDEYPSECFCPENENFGSYVRCLERDQPSWDIRATFEALNVYFGNNSRIIESLTLTASRSQSPVSLQANALSKNPFLAISWHNDNFDYIDMAAFSASYNITQDFSMFSCKGNCPFAFGNDENGFYNFLNQFTRLDTIYLLDNGFKHIVPYGFANHKSLASFHFHEGSLETIGGYAFANLPNLYTITLSQNHLTADGLSTNAFADIVRPGTFLHLDNNPGLHYLPERVFKQYLDLRGGLFVGPSTFDPENATQFLHCDQRADWICDGGDLYTNRILGYRCKELQFHDIRSYCYQNLNKLEK